MGPAHSQHSASVRVSPVSGFSKPVLNFDTKEVSQSQYQSAEVIRVAAGSEPFLATASVRSIYKQTVSGANSRRNSRRRNYVQRGEARVSVNGGLFDSGVTDSGALSRSPSRKTVRTRTLKQTSHNSTNSSYIADCSPDQESDFWNPAGFIAGNEHQLRLGINRISSIDATRSVNGHLNMPQSPKYQQTIFPGYLSTKKSDLPGRFDEAPTRMVQRRHLSEICLHLEGLYHNFIDPTPQKPCATSPQYYMPTVDYGLPMADVGPFVRMGPTTNSLYAPTTLMKSPSCQATPSQSIHYTNALIGPQASNSPFGSETDLINPDNYLDDRHDYANLPQSRAQSFNAPTRRCGGMTTAATAVNPTSRGKNNQFVNEEFDERIPLPSRRLSKSRWRFMSRSKNLTKSISCYALKFFGQQSNRTYELPEQPSLPTCSVHPGTKQTAVGVVSQRPPSFAVVKCDRGQSMILERTSPQNGLSGDLGDALQRSLCLGKPKEAERAPRLSQMVSLQAKMNRSLSAFGNRDIEGRPRPHAMRRSHHAWRDTQRDVFRRDRLQLLQATSTKELLHCLSIFILQNCGILSDMDSPLYPEEIIGWIRDIDRALIQQGWTDVPFLNPANVVFLYILLKGFVDSTITCCHELHSFVIVCLYLSYGYMGNEISYPLKPFLNAEILFSMLHEGGPHRARSVNAADPKASRNPKVINRFRDVFLEICLRVAKRKSREMLQLNSDAIFFTESVKELRSYASSPTSKNP